MYWGGGVQTQTQTNKIRQMPSGRYRYKNLLSLQNEDQERGGSLIFSFSQEWPYGWGKSSKVHNFSGVIAFLKHAPKKPLASKMDACTLKESDLEKGNNSTFPWMVVILGIVGSCAVLSASRGSIFSFALQNLGNASLFTKCLFTEVLFTILVPLYPVSQEAKWWSSSWICVKNPQNYCNRIGAEAHPRIVFLKTANGGARRIVRFWGIPLLLKKDDALSSLMAQAAV